MTGGPKGGSRRAGTRKRAGGRAGSAAGGAAQKRNEIGTVQQYQGVGQHNKKAGGVQPLQRSLVLTFCSRPLLKGDEVSARAKRAQGRCPQALAQRSAAPAPRPQSESSLVISSKEKSKRSGCPMCATLSAHSPRHWKGGRWPPAVVGPLTVRDRQGRGGMSALEAVHS